ncbi:desmoplakin-like [Brienomyrus brachyistius]|uniref:desmoplakin-like n=1 Tax=Brienomyrus brachyistius TaxID=42636 RepID=UPI0020B2BF90|nr:desmoplakin-like [Brienomyrus brachyistius]
MSVYDSQIKLHTLEKRTGDISGYSFGRGEITLGNGYGGDLMENYGTYTVTKTVSGGSAQVNIILQRASSLQAQCQEYLQKADYLLQSSGGSGRAKMDIETCISMANNLMQELQLCAMELQTLGQPNDVIFRSLDQYREMMQKIHYAIGGTLQRKKSLVTREDLSRNFQEAMAWIGQQKRLIETSTWGDDPSAIEQQIFNQNKFHSSIQRSAEVERAREELLQKRDKANLNMLEQEWESLQRMSCNRTNQLRELQAIIEEISREIMWVNEREEEELVSDWGDKNIDTYLLKRQENYSKLMCDLEEKEKDLNKLKQKVDVLLQSGHPASDKIEAYMDTLQTQWSWLLQITKCINVHLKENAAYSQFFKEANETYSKLQDQHDTMRKKFMCDRVTPLETLQELLKNLEREKERLTENKRQVQLLINKSKNIVRLKPRNAEEKTSSPVIVRALCDFKQDQKVILNGDEGILKDNSQRSKWQVTGPGGLDMLVPSICLLVPPPNPLSIALANKNEQYYEAILALFNQLFINIKSLMSWQLCLIDISRINSLTINMLIRMRPEEYRSLIRSLETNYQEFQRNYRGSELFGEEDKKNMETQYSGAQAHYNKLVVQLPGYDGKEVKGEVLKDTTFLTELHNLRLRLEASEMGLTQYLHVPLRENSVQECSQRIVQLETLYRDVGTIRDEYLRLKEKILKQLEGITDSDKAKFLQTELTAINQKLGSLEGFSTAYLDRLKALRTLFQSMLQAEDIIKVHEARLTEKDTTSQDPKLVEDYLGVLKQMRMELEQKRDVLNATDTELNNVVRCNSQISQSFHKCDVDLSKYSELVGQMNDRWRRIMAQIDNRSQDLEKFLQLLRRYIQTSSTLGQWIDETGKRQDKLQAAKINDVKVLMENLNQQKALNFEIKGKRTTVEDVQRDADTCVVSIKDYERQLAAYGAGLETLLNIPVRQTLLQSPATGISVEMGNLQSRYIELLTRSSDYYKFLGEMVKNSEELKIRNTRIDLLEEDLRLLKGDIEDRNLKNKSLEDSLARYERELTQSKDQLIILEKVKKSLTETTTTLQDKNRQVTLLTQNVEDELRKKRSMDAENARLNQALTELQAKLAASADLINKLKLTEQDLIVVTRERERLTGEKGKLELHSVDLQSRIDDFKQVVDRLEAELQKQRKETQDEATGRKRLEAELDRLTQACREYTSTITVLKRQQEEATNADRRKDQELRRLQDTLDQSMREQKTTMEKIDRLSAELKALQQQLRQEQARVKEANVRNETLYRTIEEKSRVLNDNTVEIERLQTLTQNLTKERLRLEEELSNMKMERDELMKKESSEEVLARIASLQVQLQSSGNSIVELKKLIDNLTKEKTMLKMEMAKVHKKSIETSQILHDTQTQYNDLLREKENLVAKIKMLEQDKSKVQRYDDEMNRMKTTLESEQREKQCLLDEKSRISKDFNYWKTQYELKDDQVRKCNVVKDSIERERNSLKTENERLMSELKALDERYKLRLNSTEKEVTGLTVTKETMEKELWTLKQEKTVDPSMLVFDGVRKKVTAPQLCDCRVIDNATLNQLINGKKTVQDVAVDIQVNLKGTGIIAGITGGPEGKMSITEAKNKNLLTPQSATMLLEAQAATGYIIDPKQNEKMTVDMAYAKGLVDAQDRDKLITAEAASTGFKDRLTGKLLSVGQAMRKGLIDKESTLRLLQAQEAVGGILDPVLSVFLPKDVALDRGLIDDDLYRALNMRPECYIDPANQQKRCYIDLKMKSKPEAGTGFLLLNDIDKPLEVPGLRKQVPILQLVYANLLTTSDVDGLIEGRITKEDIMHRLRSYLRGSSCIAGIYDNAKQRPLSFYQAMKEGLLKPGTTLELLEAQAASGFLIDPVNNLYLTVEEALQKGLVGMEFKDNLLSAERAVTGYKNPRTDETISLFQAIEKGLIQKGHGIRLLEAQIASGGIIDPAYSHRIDVDVAYGLGYLDREMNDILSRESDETRGFFDPSTEENLTYRQLKQRCIPDTKTGLLLLPLKEQKGTQQLRKRRVMIVDPDTKVEMTVREAYEKHVIDYETYLELSSQECEWEETTFSGPDGSTRLIITDKKTGVRYDIQDCLSKGILDQATVDKYRSRKLTLKAFADLLTRKAGSGLCSDSISVPEGITRNTQSQTFSSTTSKYVSSLSMALSRSADGMTEQSPIGAIFDSATLEKLSISEAQRRGIIDSITAQCLLEAQACTGGIINPTTGRRFSLRDAVYQGFIDEDMAARLNPAQKAYVGFEDVKTQRMMSVAEAMKEMWLPYDAGQKFIEYQYVTGGLVDPQLSQRISLEEAIQKGWVDARGAQRLRDIKQHTKDLTCPKTKLKISYKEALDNSLVEENSGVMMLQAPSMSSKGISSSYNVSTAPGSQNGSLSQSWDGSSRGSMDHISVFNSSYTYSSNTLF